MKNNTPSSEFEHEDKCPSCGSPCNIHTDLDDNDKCNECRNQIDTLEMGQIIPKEESTFANIRCTCMSFEPNCFTGSCRKCGFLPKEEPKQGTMSEAIKQVINNQLKQETLEEAFDRIFDSIDYTEFDFTSFEQGVKWQQERSYSEEDMKEAFKNGAFKWRMHSGGKCFEEWFEQFKKK